MKKTTSIGVIAVAATALLGLPAQSWSATTVTWPTVSAEWTRLAQVIDPKADDGVFKDLGGTYTGYAKYRVLCKGVDNQAERTAYFRQKPDGNTDYGEQTTRWDKTDGWKGYGGGRVFKFTFAQVSPGPGKGVHCFLWGSNQS